MKRFIIALSMLLLTACQSSTEFGPCVGVSEAQNPKLEYRLSVRNVFMAWFFAGLIIPPVMVVINETYCPTAQKQ